MDDRSQFRIRLGDTEWIDGELLLLENSTRAYVRFDFTDVAPSRYDLLLFDGEGNESLRSLVVTVLQGQPGTIEGGIGGPALSRAGEQQQMLLNYTNTGNSDIDAPLIIISSPTETGVAMRESIYSDHSIALMGLAMDGPPNIIRPGQVGEFPLQFVMDSHDVTFHADVVETSDTRPLDRSLLDSLRPAGVEVVQWSGAVELLLAKIDGQGSVSGPTLGEFARMLGATADRLFELEGRRVHRRVDALGV